MENKEMGGNDRGEKGNGISGDWGRSSRKVKGRLRG